jgi:hypothetical protein
MINDWGWFTLRRMKSSTQWNLLALLESPLFAPLHPVLARLGVDEFPSLHDFNALLAECQPPITVHGDLPLYFVAQEPGKLPFEAQYEPRCYLKGEVQTREHNWHDLFNALVWLTFPQAKAAINERHYRSLIDRPADGSSQRGRVRDMLTLLDESGVVVACADTELEGLLREFQWKELFWYQRERVSSAMDFYLFGHGLYEKALQPYIGMTGQGLIMTVEREFFAWPLEQRLLHLDGLLTEYLMSPAHGLNSRELTPVPLLGVPGWWEGNKYPLFYDDYSYFRCGRLP